MAQQTERVKKDTKQLDAIHQHLKTILDEKKKLLEEAKEKSQRLLYKIVKCNDQLSKFELEDQKKQEKEQ